MCVHMYVRYMSICHQIGQVSQVSVGTHSALRLSFPRVEKQPSFLIFTTKKHT